MKMSVIIGVAHMTFGVCLSFFNYMQVFSSANISCLCSSLYLCAETHYFVPPLVRSRHSGDVSSVFLVLIPELVFMLCLFGYLVFMVVFKWVAFGPQDSSRAPSLLIHFIDMFLFTQNPENPPLYPGQVRNPSEQPLNESDSREQQSY